MHRPFSITRLPRIEFGPGAVDKLGDKLGSFGTRVLIVCGASSLQRGPAWSGISDQLRAGGLDWEIVNVAGEPSPAFIDSIVGKLRTQRFDVVAGIGGGSALDAAKAIAGLLIPGNSVMDHLEGVGQELPYHGPATPFIAVPTTAGTGSEATKNAVLSTPGKQGFKKSFRDERLVAEYAIVDPDLLATCPPRVIAANGMDAFTQLLESYVSAKANPFTDALAISGMKAVRDSLLPWYAGGGDVSLHRHDMAYAALMSGITLAQVGLGSVHGLASPLGAFFPIPHGVVCGTLVAEATRINLRAMRERDPGNPSLAKYATVGRLLAGRPVGDEEAQDLLVEKLEEWTRLLELARLSAYGVTDDDVQRIVANSRGSSMKTNPIVLLDDEIACIIRARL